MSQPTLLRIQNKYGIKRPEIKRQYKKLFYMNIIKLEQLTTVGEVKPNSLIQGNCLEAMKFLADKSIDMILCDLPYG